MSKDCTKGIAFIMEGATEKEFYKSFLKWMANENDGCTFEKGENADIGEIVYFWTNKDKKILIKFNVVGAITQMVNSEKWFSNTCAKKYRFPWTVYLCYDTDSPNEDISKFYQGDWKILRENLKRSKAVEVIDLAASADIEDVMLCDKNGVCDYLGIEVCSELHGRKGKAKMKALFRSCGKTYHEGEKSTEMIESLDFKTIMEVCPIKLKLLRDELLS